jgi:hypothetical protein
MQGSIFESGVYMELHYASGGEAREQLCGEVMNVILEVVGGPETEYPAVVPAMRLNKSS